MLRASARRSELAIVAASALTLVTAFLPWARTGRIARSGFSLALAAVRAGFPTGLVIRAGLAVFFLMPAMLGAAWIAAGIGHFKAARVLLSVGALAAFGAATAVLASDLRPLAGVWASIVAAVIALGVGVLATHKEETRA